MSAKRFQVGQRVVIRLSRNRGAAEMREATVTKVGRKWVSYCMDGWRSGSRFDAETMLIDGEGYSSPGRVYLSMADMDAALRRGRLISKLTGALGGWQGSRSLRSVSTENIEQAMKLLGIDAEERAE